MSIDSYKVIKVLWTGGWDSTFRVLSLADKDVEVHPYYVLGDRKSRDIEIATINKISDAISARPTTKFKLAPLKIVEESSLKPDPSIKQAFNSLLKENFMGSQYSWLARLAKTEKGLELCIHRDDKAFKLIESVGTVEQFQDSAGSNVRVDQARSPDDLNKVFGDFHFPILDFTKLEMKAYAEKVGFIDLMQQTWFCYTPIGGEACGLCNPCKYTIEEGMEYRLSSKALRRYKYRNFILFPKRVIRKLSKVLSRG